MIGRSWFNFFWEQRLETMRDRRSSEEQYRSKEKRIPELEVWMKKNARGWQDKSKNNCFTRRKLEWWLSQQACWNKKISACIENRKDEKSESYFIVCNCWVSSKTEIFWKTGFEKNHRWNVCMPTLETQIGLSLFKDCLNFFNVSALKNLCKSQNHLPAYVASSLEIIAPFVELLTQHQINFRDNSFFREKAQLSFTKKSKSTSPLRPPPLTSPYNEEVFKQLVPIFFSIRWNLLVYTLPHAYGPPCWPMV